MGLSKSWSMDNVTPDRKGQVKVLNVDKGKASPGAYREVCWHLEVPGLMANAVTQFPHRA